MSARTVLVTGATGFIGRRLCDAAAKTGVVHALSRRPGDGPWRECFVADLGRDAIPASAVEGVDTVFHLAARTHAVPQRNDDAEYDRVNVVGTSALLEVCRGAGVRRFVFMSSVKAIGEGGAQTIADDALPEPRDPYGRSKREAEQLVLDGGYVPEPVVLRPCLVYGPGVGGNLEGLIAAIESGRFPPPGRCHNRRSLVHVDDVVAAALLVAGAPRAVGRAFVVTDGVAYSTDGMVDAIRAALGKSPARWRMPRALFRALAAAGDVAEFFSGRTVPFDSSAYRKLFGSAHYSADGLRELGYRPIWTLDEALPQILRSRQ